MKVINGYRILKYIVKGGYSHVYLVKTKSLEDSSKKYVMKKIKNSLLNKSEIDIHKKLNHPNIVQLIATFTHGSYTYMILERMKCDLHTHLYVKQKPVHVKTCIRSMLKALQYLHDNDIIYADLKPENVLIGQETSMSFKLCDFGLSWIYSEKIHDDDYYYGTFAYMAPEIFNEESLGFELDLWAVGILCYELLFQKTPFEGKTDLQIGYNISILNIDYPNNISHLEKDFIQKLLVKESSERMSSYDALNHDYLKVN